MITGGITTRQVLEELVLAPLKHPELLPSLTPIILGAIIIELYFGRYSQEQLGWNTSVGNSIIWIATGVNLLINSSLEPVERNAAFFLIAVGGLVGYMDFFHKWSSTVAFMVSSAGIVYSLAYITVVLVKTGIPINNTSIKASLIFLVAVNIVFKVMQMFETSADNQFSMR